MNLQVIHDISRYQDIINQYKQKGCLSNDYLYAEVTDLISKEQLFECCYNNNAFLFVQKDMCMRVYYYLNDFTELCPFDGDKNYVVEILFRGNCGIPEIEIDYLLKCGFHLHLRRDLFCGTYKDLVSAVNTNFIIRKAKTRDEVQAVCEVFNNIFDPYSGDYLSESMISKLLEDGDIWIATDAENNLAGGLHQTIDHGVSWVSHIAVKPAFRGRGVGRALIDSFVEHNRINEKTRYMMWVQSKNEPAIRLYQKKGFIYMNKSSMSMLITNK